MKGRNEIVDPRHELERQRDAHAAEHASTTRSTRTRTTAAPSTRPLVFALNGNIKGGHVVTASRHARRQAEHQRRLQPRVPDGLPERPGEHRGRVRPRAVVRAVRVVLSGVARLPWQITVAPIFEYGSGQPWTQRLGYDYNGDGKNCDRPAGVDRFAEDGPRYRSLNLRVSKVVQLRRTSAIERHRRGASTSSTPSNYDVTSIDGARVPLGPDDREPGAAPSSRTRTTATPRRRCRRARSSSA